MGTTLIKAKITDQTLEFTLKPMVASGGVNEDVIEFEFDELWDGFNTVAVFYRSKRDVFHIKIVGNRCTVPSEVLRAQGVFYVGVMGVKDNVTRTTNVLRYEIEHGAITAGVEPPEPTPSIYEQILETVKSTKQIAQSVRDDADAGRFNGAPGPKGDPGSDASVTAENIQSALGYAPVKDVQVAGSSVLDSGVANVPVASDTKEGVIRASHTDGSFGIRLNENNRPCVVAASEADITARRTYYRPITPANLDYAVKAAMCDGNGAAWTDDEQKAARERMRIDKPYELIEEITLTEKVMQISRNAEPDGTGYAFEAVTIKIHRTNTGAGSVVVFSGSKDLCWSGISEVGQYYACETFLQHGYWQHYRYGPTDSSNSYPSIIPNGHKYFLLNAKNTNKYIDRIVISSDTAGFDTGTTISIYGVRT